VNRQEKGEKMRHKVLLVVAIVCRYSLIRTMKHNIHVPTSREAFSSIG
jgi:hypothetical protein